MSTKIGKSGIALQTKSRLHCIRDLVSQQYGHTFENVHASEECVGADMLDSVVRVTDHDPAGGPPLAIANRIRIAAKRADVVENPFLMATLFFHVLHQGVLIALVRSA